MSRPVTIGPGLYARTTDRPDSGPSRVPSTPRAPGAGLRIRSPEGRHGEVVSIDRRGSRSGWVTIRWDAGTVSERFVGREADGSEANGWLREQLEGAL